MMDRRKGVKFFSGIAHIEIYAFHGFLGCPSDWEIIKNDRQGWKWHLVDVFNEKFCQPQRGLQFWASSFNSSIKHSNAKKILLGYSLGGRLALHALIGQPSLWDAAVIVSANPGLPNSKEKAKRIMHDTYWANRFLTEPWDILLEDWNSQSVFSGDSKGIQRFEENFSRNTLADVLRGWSLGTQNDLRQKLQESSNPILWMAGERDNKFATIARSLTFSHPQSKVWIASEAGHRVPWQQTETFLSQLQAFLGEL